MTIEARGSTWLSALCALLLTEPLGVEKRLAAALDFEAGPAPTHLQPWQPKGWTRFGPAAGCFAVVRAGGDGTAVGLSDGAALEISLAVPPPPREAEPGGYEILIGFDLLPNPTPDRGPPGAVTVSARVDGESTPIRVATVGLIPSQVAPSSLPRASRHWIHLDSDATDRLLLKSLRLRLESREKECVTVDRVEIVRVPIAPTWKHLGRSNGGLGPDRLGAGALGFDALAEHLQSPLVVVEVRALGPAARAGLRPGDVLVAVEDRPFPRSNLEPGAEWFETSHEAVLGRAVSVAVQRAQASPAKPSLQFHALRRGTPITLNLILSPRLPLDQNFPFGAQGDAHLAVDVLANVLAQQKSDGSFGGNFVRTGLGVLALLGTRDQKRVPLAAKAMTWMIERHDGPEDSGLAYWSIGYTGMALGEYHLATGDTSVLRWAKRAQHLCRAGAHTSAFGMTSLGHGPDGLPYENKALMAPLGHLLAFEALVGLGGVKPVLWPEFQAFSDAAWSDPVEGGHGAMGYNASYRDQDEFWSRTGLCLAAARLRGDRPRMREAMVKVMRERHAWMLNSHAYGEPGAALGLLALAGADRAAFREVMHAWRWKFEGAWEPGFGLRYTTPHMGSPYMGEDDLLNVAYAAVFAVRQEGLVLAGAKPEPWAKGLVPPLLDVAVPHAAPPNPKSKWRVLLASGAASPELAIERASRAIDGDPVLGWRTDTGKDGAGYPHHLVIDFGSARIIHTIQFRFADEELSPSQCLVSTSSDGLSFTAQKTPDLLLPSDKDAQLRLDPPVHRRYLRLEFQSPRKEGARGLALRELEVLDR